MADFKQAIQITAINEGGWNDTPGDNGGETYAGISRKFWPNWGGWKYIDDIKGLSSIKPVTEQMMNNAIKYSSVPFQILVADFYKQNFWDALKLDLVNDQQVANNLYDMAVNSGTYEASKMLQEAVGVVADGIVGPKTIAAVNEENGHVVFDAINTMRREFYNNLATHPNQRQFLKSWLSRLIDYKTG